MSKCPKCKNEIEILIAETPALITQRFWITEETPYPEYQDIDRNFNGKTKFYCPDCDNIIFRNEEKAILFLKG